MTLRSAKRWQPRLEALETRALFSVSNIVVGTALLDVSLTGPDQGVFGQPMTYQIALMNSGSVTANGITITDTFSQNSTFVSGSINGTPLTAVGNVLISHLDHLDGGGTVIGSLTLIPHQEKDVYDLINASADNTPPSNTAEVNTQVIDRIFASGDDQGNRPQVNVYDAVTGALRMTFNAYDLAFSGASA